MLPVHHPFCTEDGSGVKMMIKSLEAVFLPPLADAVVTAWLSTRVVLGTVWVPGLAPSISFCEGKRVPVMHGSVIMLVLFKGSHKGKKSMQVVTKILT